jgi:hypothetical protein
MANETPPLEELPMQNPLVPEPAQSAFVSAPALSPFAPPNAEPSPAKRWPGVARLLGLSVVAFALALLLELACVHFEAPELLLSAVGIVGFGASTLLAGWGVARGVSGLFGAPAATLEIYGLIGSLALSFLSLLMLAAGALAALAATFGFSRGRQLRRRGRVLLPPVRAGGTWTSSAASLGDALTGALAHTPDARAGAFDARAGAARQWRENGRTEHASVASFARLTLDLMALGAPPALVAAANQDALDEIRHTEACFGLAQALDGRAESPGPFPEAQTARSLPRARSFALATLAVNSLVDGALHEGVSARVLAKLARHCETPPIADLLKRIAADEGRHAAHGWDVVEWCLEEGGANVASALCGAARVLPLRMRSNLPEAAGAGAWQRWGIHSLALEADVYAATRAQLLRRLRELIAALPKSNVSRAA